MATGGGDLLDLDNRQDKENYRGSPLRNERRSMENQSPEGDIRTKRWIAKMVELGVRYAEKAPQEELAEVESIIAADFDNGGGFVESKGKGAIPKGTKSKPLKKSPESKSESRASQSNRDRDNKEQKKFNRSVNWCSTPRSRRLLNEEDTSSDGDSEESTDSDSPARKPRAGGRQDNRRKEEPMMTAREVSKLIRKLSLGQRNVPEPAKFGLESAQPFEDFKAKFERYCKGHYTDVKDDWIPILERFLMGDLKDIYLSVQEGTNSYDEVMEEIEGYHKRTIKAMTRDRKGLVRTMTMHPGEGVDKYVVRLEGIAKSAYGSKFEKPARRRLMETVPSSFQNALVTKNWDYQLMYGKDLPWELVKSWATLESRGKSRRSTREWDQEVMDVYTSTVQNKEQPGKSKSKLVDRHSQTQTATDCEACGMSGHGSNECRRRLRLCFRCGGPDHMARHCDNYQRAYLQGELRQLREAGEPNEDRGRPSYRNTNRRNWGEYRNPAGYEDRGDYSPRARQWSAGRVPDPKYNENNFLPRRERSMGRSRSFSRTRPGEAERSQWGPAGNQTPSAQNWNEDF